jgi:hypothetical protein
VEHDLIEQLMGSEPGTGFYIVRARLTVHSLPNTDGVPRASYSFYLPKAHGNSAIDLAGFDYAPVFCLIDWDAGTEEPPVVLCLFKSKMDAEEYINHRLDPDCWEAYQAPNPRRALVELTGASRDCTHVTLNPPLPVGKPIKIIAMAPVLAHLENGGDIRDLAS